MPYDCSLYLLTPPELPSGFADTLARALDEGGVTAVQLRLKDADDDKICRGVELIRPIVQARDIALILNDRPDLAVKTGCDGAHVGGEDMPVSQSRRTLGKALQLGVSCYDSRDLAIDAAEAGADYIAFGTFFPSGTKNSGYIADIELLQWWSEVAELPCVAIGGITAENCAPLVRAGANFLAVIGAVWGHADGSAAGIRALNAAIAAA